jgi:hypothetical protein
MREWQHSSVRLMTTLGHQWDSPFAAAVRPPVSSTWTGVPLAEVTASATFPRFVPSDLLVWQLTFVPTVCAIDSTGVSSHTTRTFRSSPRRSRRHAGPRSTIWSTDDFARFDTPPHKAGRRLQPRHRMAPRVPPPNDVPWQCDCLLKLGHEDEHLRSPSVQLTHLKDTLTGSPPQISSEHERAERGDGWSPQRAINTPRAKPARRLADLLPGELTRSPRAVAA